METKKYIKLQDLEVYKLAREMSGIGWKIYKDLDWQTKKIMGDQFIESTDSVGANIAEGYSRFHYKEQYKKYKDIAERTSLKLQNFISAIYRAKDNNKYP